MKYSNNDFHAILARRRSNIKGVHPNRPTGADDGRAERRTA